MRDEALDLEPVRAERMRCHYPFIDPLRLLLPTQNLCWPGPPDLEFDFYRGPVPGRTRLRQQFEFEVSLEYRLYAVKNLALRKYPAEPRPAGRERPRVQYRGLQKRRRGDPAKRGRVRPGTRRAVRLLAGVPRRLARRRQASRRNRLAHCETLTPFERHPTPSCTQRLTRQTDLTETTPRPAAENAVPERIGSLRLHNPAQSDRRSQEWNGERLGYRLFHHSGRFYAVPGVFGPVCLADRRQRSNPWIFSAATANELCRDLDRRADEGTLPLYLETLAGHAILSCGENYYALEAPSPDAEFDEEEEANPKVLVERSLTELRRRILKLDDRELPGNVLGTFEGYGLSEVGGRVCAYPLAMQGAADLAAGDRADAGVLEGNDSRRGGRGDPQSAARRVPSNSRDGFPSSTHSATAGPPAIRPRRRSADGIHLRANASAADRSRPARRAVEAPRRSGPATDQNHLGDGAARRGMPQAQELPFARRSISSSAATSTRRCRCRGTTGCCF